MPVKNICFFNRTKFGGGGEKLHLEFAQLFKKRGYLRVHGQKLISQPGQNTAIEALL